MGLLRANLTTDSESFCTTNLSADVTPVVGVAAELLATAIFIFFTCAAWDPRNSNKVDSLSLKFGLCIAMLCLAFMPFTGCGLNPARVFAPAAWNGFWANHWVYWIGPLLGSIIASSIYRCAFSSKRNRDDPMQDVNTLNSVDA